MLFLPETDEPTGEVRDLWAVLWDELVPKSGPSRTLQGEVLRAQGNLSYEAYQNGMINYYGQCLEGAKEGYPTQVDWLIETLLTDPSNALAAADREYLVQTRAAILEDRGHVEERASLEEKAEEGPLTDEETARLEVLRSGWSEGDWESLFDRTERLVINYCIARPDLLDRDGKPVRRGRRSLEDVLQRPAGRVDPVKLDGSPGWLGLQVTWSTEGLRVDGVDERSPSFGLLRPGDDIERIDGQLTATLDGPEWAQKLLAGPAGAPVWLRVTREPVAQLVTVVRARRPA